MKNKKKQMTTYLLLTSIFLFAAFWVNLLYLSENLIYNFIFNLIIFMFILQSAFLRKRYFRESEDEEQHSKKEKMINYIPIISGVIVGFSLIYFISNLPQLVTFDFSVIFTVINLVLWGIISHKGFWKMSYLFEEKAKS